MSVSYIPEKVKVRLWGKAAGRCQYEGCNKPLWYDDATKAEFNSAYIAHIVADSPGGPRGDKDRSSLLSQDISNLMLMCDTHHRLIDRHQVEEHPEGLLVNMKKKHEEKMGILTSLTEEKQSHVLLYSANIGGNHPKVNMDQAIHAMLPDKYPADKLGIGLSVGNSQFNDGEDLYWLMEVENLRRQFKEKVLPRLEYGVNHMSVFAIAPQPLLIELGRLISDIQTAEVYQPHREPDSWQWEESIEGFGYRVTSPEIESETVALNLSLSGTIDNSRITDILGGNASIWTVTIEKPHNDFLRSREQLKQFRQELRKLFDHIKKKHGQKNELHVFPAVPVSVAIEMGRVWMPKADLSLRIYDQNKKDGTNEFVHVLDIE